MKRVSLVARLALGLMFVVFGLNGFLHFLPMPLPEGLAAQFLGAMAQSHYMAAVFAIELIGGSLLLAGRFVPLALTLLGPVIVNILLFHTLMEWNGLPLAIIASILWLLAFWSVRQSFAGLLVERT